ncbi:MAG: hypothetical protein H6705_16705 [Myxococcales bacterium]|nr:hypothetical protein [Myxococcales bacterium]
MSAQQQGRCTAADKELRTATVVGWVRAGVSRAGIINKARAAWGLAPRTTDAYLRRARELVAGEARAGVRDELREAREAARAAVGEANVPTFEEMPSPETMRLMLFNLFYKVHLAAFAAGDFSAAAKCGEQLARLGQLGDRKGDDDDDVEALAKKARQAFEIQMTGAQESRAARGLAPIAVGAQ